MEDVDSVVLLLDCVVIALPSTQAISAYLKRIRTKQKTKEIMPDTTAPVSKKNWSLLFFLSVPSILDHLLFMMLLIDIFSNFLAG